MGMVSAVVLLSQGEPTTAARQFDALGFQTQVVSPKGLTITGGKSLFSKNFGVVLSVGEDGVWVVKESQRSRSVPKAKLPAALREQVQAIEFEAPLDFGPSKF